MTLPIPWTAQEAAATFGLEWSALRSPADCTRGTAWRMWREGVTAAVAAGLLEMRALRHGTPKDGGGWCEWRRVA